MTPLPLNDETIALAESLIWFEPPAEALADPIRFVAYAFVGAASELAAAWIDGRLDISLAEMIASTIKLYEHLVRFDSGASEHEASPLLGRESRRRRRSGR